MTDWMAMSAANLDPHAAWEQYQKVTGAPDSAWKGQNGPSYNLYPIFLAGIEYAEASPMAIAPELTVKVELTDESYRALLRLYHELGDALMALRPSTERES